MQTPEDAHDLLSATVVPPVSGNFCAGNYHRRLEFCRALMIARTHVVGAAMTRHDCLATPLTDRMHKMSNESASRAIVKIHPNSRQNAPPDPHIERCMQLQADRYIQ